MEFSVCFWNVRLTLVALLAVAAIASPVAAQQAAEPTTATQSRIVTLGGTITEIVFALGAGDRIVGVDQSSYHPEEVNRLPKLNYHRQMSAEGILSLRPTEVLLNDESGPPSAIEQLRKAGLKLTLVKCEPALESAEEQIKVVAKALGREEEGRRLIEGLQKDIARLNKLLKEEAKSKPRVLFIYARGGGLIMAGGRKTAADAMIRLAGGVNAVDSFEEFRPLSAESMIAARPDVILMMDKGLESVGGVEAIRAMPGLAQTEAVKNGRIVAMDDLYLLGFGPRLGRAAIDLACAIHPELAIETSEKSR